MGKIIRILLIVILVLNILAIDIFLFLFWKKNNPINLVKNQENCPTDCIGLIDQKITELPRSINDQQSPTLTPSPIVSKTTLASKTKSTQYIPIPGSGSTLENKWIDLMGTEFYISTDDYPNLTGAYFEANMKLLNGNGTAYLRLFDITAGIEVWGSEISTNSQSFTSISSDKLTIRSGTHLYRVQAKSLTADTTVFNSGRIKVILEN
ncbi:MAG: hypothetical protein PHX34_01150 [Candidatus Shapirobacteria bacterium]|nr:hypothetical protein [Candidatus Shapirobacteria bacterium]